MIGVSCRDTRIQLVIHVVYTIYGFNQGESPSLAKLSALMFLEVAGSLQRHAEKSNRP